MSQITTGSIRKWISLVMALVLVVSLATWLVQRQPLPRTIRIATGVHNGLYHKVGDSISKSIEDRIGRAVVPVETDGSRQNFNQLMEGEVDLAIVQGGAVPIEDVLVVTPLFREFVFVVARKGTNIESVWELGGRKLSLGPIGSGNRDAAVKVLEHFGIDAAGLNEDNVKPFTVLRSDDSFDAAIVTAGIEHSLLQDLLATHEFEIIPIRSALAMELVHPFIRNVEVPRGLFAEHPPVPPDRIPTIATTAYLVCSEDASAELVEAALASIHEESLRLNVPTLIARQEATRSTATRMHPIAQRYFNPEDNIGAVVSVMESMVATKELLFAIGAGIYLLWVRWRRLQEKELQASVHRQKERLDKFLMETLQIEKEQAKTVDIDELQAYLDNVTRIKLKALQELSEEELRGNQEFSIFLDQCSTLIGRIQMKILSQQVSPQSS